MTGVETAPRLAQWRVNALPAFTCRKSDPFRIGLWNWYLSVERNIKHICIKLSSEVSSSTRDTPPIASFLIKLLLSSPLNQKTIAHPGIFDKQLKHDGFFWAVDTAVTGRFVIEIDFLDLKIANPSGGEPTSIWSSCNIKHSSNNATLSSLARMLQEGIHADITINATGGSIGAHRAILSMRSPVFRSMFSHDLKEKELSAIDIPDMSLEACRAFLNYIYGNFQGDEFLSHRLALLRAADKYDISDLKEACHESLQEDIDTKNVLERLQTAHLYRLLELKNSCKRFLVDFRKVYEIDDDFKAFLQTADRDLIAEVFQDVLAAWNGL